MPTPCNQSRRLGADVTIPLVEDEAALEEPFKEQFAAGVDVVIDYLWGQSAECLLIAGAKAGQDAVPIRFVQVGSASGSDITLPSAVLRSSAIELMGSGIGSIPLDASRRRHRRTAAGDRAGRLQDRGQARSAVAGRTGMALTTAPGAPCSSLTCRRPEIRFRGRPQRLATPTRALT